MTGTISHQYVETIDLDFEKHTTLRSDALQEILRYLFIRSSQWFDEDYVGIWLRALHVESLNAIRHDGCIT